MTGAANRAKFLLVTIAYTMDGANHVFLFWAMVKTDFSPKGAMAQCSLNTPLI